MESVPWPPRKQATLTPQKTELYIYANGYSNATYTTFFTTVHFAIFYGSYTVTFLTTINNYNQALATSAVDKYFVTFSHITKRPFSLK